MENKLERDFQRTKDVITSCKTPEQLKVGVKMYNRLNDIYDMSEEQINKLQNLIGLMRIKCNVEDLNEGESAIDKEFHKYTQMTGVPEIQQLRFNEGEGVSEDMSPEELAEKHGVDLKDIKKEIDLGTKIEMEHTDSKEEAKRIAMDHIFEFSDYYSDPMFGIVAIEKYKDGHRKTIRLSKDDMEKLHKDGNIVLDGISIKFPDSEEDEIEEATGAGSSGAYTGPLFSKINRRSFKKSDITDNIPTSVTGLPIGKMYSFNEEKEVLEEEEELDEATSVASVGGQYVTPKFWAKGKDNWRNRIKKTYPGGKFVNIKKKCKKFPYCDQGSGGPSGSPITLTDKSEMEVDGYFNESFVIKKTNLKLK